jgi:hypothetical protein
MKRLTFRVAASLALAGAVVACVVDPLNPQPLPPNKEDGSELFDASAAPHNPDGSLVFSPTPDDAGSNASLDGAPPNAAPDADAGDAGDADADAH